MPSAATVVLDRRQPDWAMLAVVGAAIMAHAVALGAGFVWDDDDYVTQNVTLRSLDGLRRIWLEPGAVPQYYPITFTTFWFEYRVAGASPLLYHATNVVLHAIASGLVYRVLRCLAVDAALLGALLFAVHPVHVESVAWIAERKNVLSTLLYLGAMDVYLRGIGDDGSATRPSRRSWTIALLLFVAALGSKTVACTLPVALAIIDWWRHGRVRWRAVAALIPFVLVGVGAGLVTIWMEKTHVGARGVAWDLTTVERTLIATRAVWFYLGKLLVPIPLIFNYPRWTIDAGALWQWSFPLALALLAGVLWVLRDRVGRAPIAALGFFVVTLGPALGLVDVYPMRYSFVADHFQYVASLGPLVIGAGTLVRFAGHARGRVVGGVLVAMLAVLSWRQASAYADLETLWRDTLDKHPASTLALVNLGNLEHHRGRHAEALALFDRAEALEPDQADVPNNIGLALMALGRTAEASSSFERALARDPRHAEAASNLGNVLASEGRLADAIVAYERALAAKPRYADAHNNLGTALAMTGRPEEAIPHLRQAVMLDPRYVDARSNLGILLIERGELVEAEGHLRVAVSERPDSARGHFHLGRALRRLGRADEAALAFQRAVVLDGSLAPAVANER